MPTEVLVPPLGQTVDTVTLVAWRRQEGDTVAQGEMLYAIETDKAVLDVEAPASGVLCSVTAQPGDKVKVLSRIALIAAPGEPLADAPAAAPEPARHAEAPTPAPRAVVQPSAQRAAGRILASPRARRLAEAHQVPLAALTASGPEGAIVERDVRAYLDAQAAPAPIAADRAQVQESIPFAGVRAAIAARMLASATSTARVTLTAEADASELVALRRRLREAGADVSYDALFLRVLAHALREQPLPGAQRRARLSASLEGDAIRPWSRIDIGLAVDAERGLLVPVVREANRKGLARLTEEVRALAKRARSGRCTPAELSGGTFTLTNLGMFGIDSFTPIISPPECAILGVGRITERPTVVGGEVVARPMVWLSLSFDQRLVDGAPAARFLARVVQLVECPYLLLS